VQVAFGLTTAGRAFLIDPARQAWAETKGKGFHMADAVSTTQKTPKRTTAKKTTAAKTPTRTPAAPKSNTAVARSRFNAALEEAKAGELAREGKDRASDALASLGKVVADNATTLDGKFGTRYGDYARSAARGLQETAAKLDNKSVEQIGEDAREMVRKSPAAAVGLAALAGFLFARMFRRR
jgi:ElaB/YqjD/DUF883 family membrane-anchored ribosome-binding protein